MKMFAGKALVAAAVLGSAMLLTGKIAYSQDAAGAEVPAAHRRFRNAQALRSFLYAQLLDGAHHEHHRRFVADAAALRRG